MRASIIQTFASKDVLEFLSNFFFHKSIIHGTNFGFKLVWSYFVSTYYVKNLLDYLFILLNKSHESLKNYVIKTINRSSLQLPHLELEQDNSKWVWTFGGKCMFPIYTRSNGNIINVMDVNMDGCLVKL